MDDSGMFSVQVITEALKIYGLNIKTYTLQGQEAQNAPITGDTYFHNSKYLICSDYI